MSTPQPTEALNQDERTSVEQAERRGHPFLLLRDGEATLHVVALDGRRRSYTIGRRTEADIPLPWDREVSRVHAQLDRLAGEWTVTDDGLSQNGTFINEMRLIGRRRLMDGDLLRVGRTALTFRNPTIGTGGLTLLPGELSAATALSEQQHQVLRELCRPIARDGAIGINPASDDAIADALAIPVEVVANEIAGLCGAFGIDDVPAEEARAEIAMAALGSGLVSFEDLSG
jgi:hypothetical protein